MVNYDQALADESSSVFLNINSTVSDEKEDREYDLDDYESRVSSNDFVWKVTFRYSEIVATGYQGSCEKKIIPVEFDKYVLSKNLDNLLHDHDGYYFERAEPITADEYIKLNKEGGF